MARTLIKEIKDRKKNYAINGNFNLWQRTNANQTFGAGIVYHADRFAWASGTITGQVTSARSLPTDYSNNTIIPRSCAFIQKYTVSTAQPSLSADSTAGPWYKMEGYDWQEMLEQGALTTGFTLSFYVASSVTGTYTIELFNNSINNRFFRTYSITSANTWQRVSIYYSAAEVATGIGSGGWNYTNQLGLAFRFWLACGTNSNGATQNAWTGSTANVPAAQVNFLSTLSNNWGITGLQLSIGNVTPDFKIRGESPTAELEMCQRYYEKSYNIDVNPGAIDNAGRFTVYWTQTNRPYSYIPFKVAKRAAPTPVVYNPITGASGTLRTETGANVTAGIDAPLNGHSAFSVFPSTSTSYPAGMYGHYTADAEL